MKHHSIVFVAAFSLVAALHGQTAVGSRPPMRTAPTNEELVLQLRESEQEMAEHARSKPLSSPVDNRPVEVPDLISRSEILCYNGALTLVPKRAVLQFPKNLADRLKPQPGARVQNWSEFYAANLGWITVVEVSKLQAQGKEPFSEQTATHISKCGKLVVATFGGNPIAVLPPQKPETSSPDSPASAPVATSTPQRP